MPSNARKARTLRRTLMITLVWAIIIPVLIVGAVSSALSYFRMKAVLVEKNDTLASLTAQMMEQRLQSIHSDLQARAGAADKPGAGQDNPQVLLDGIVEAYDEIDSALLTDASGTVTCVTPHDPNVIGTDMSAQVFHRKVRETGKSYWSPQFVSSQWLRPSSSLSIPAMGGTLTVYFDLSSLVADVRAVRAGEGTVLAIVDQHGTYVAHTDPEKARTSVREPHYKQFRDEFQGEPLERRVEHDGVPVVSYVDFIGNTGWAIIVYQPVKQLQEPLTRMVLALSAVTLVIVAGAIAVFSRHIRSVLRSTNRLLAGAGRIADGEYEPITGGETFEEFAELAERFNAMAGAIDSRERSLRESEQRFRTVIEQAGDALYLCDPGGRIIDVNVQACGSLGYSRDEMLTMTASDVDVLLPAEKVADVVHTLSSGEGMTIEGIHRCKDGSTFHVETRICLIELAGQPRILGLARDVTERRRLEEQLRHSQKMDAIGQLAGGVAHDFNNQLAGILGYADMLAHSLPEGESRSDAEAIAKAAKRSADLTQQLLAFARKGKTLTVAVDMHEIIAEVVSLLERSIDKRIEVVQTLRAEPSTTIGDPTQLQNALLNVAINARDAMPDGGKIIMATDVATLDQQFCQQSRHEIIPGRYIVVSISDTGKGMDRQTQQRIFEPFFTTKEVGRGTGMGMAAVYGTARSHRGAAAVYSEVGHGTMVRLYLPVRAAVESATPSVAPEPASAVTPARILLVDDEDAVRRMATQMLQRLGHEVTACANGADAVEHYVRNHERIDMVILDMVMPNLGGRDTYLAMRKIDPDVRALLSSGYSIDGEAQKILDEGVSGFLQKPFRLDELAGKIGEVLR